MVVYELKKQSFLKGSVILMCMVLITKLLGLMYKIPLTRILGGVGMGYFSSAYSVFTPIFAIVVSGIPSTMAKLSAENYALERYTNLRRIRHIAYFVFGFIGLIVTALTIIFSGCFSQYIMHEPDSKYALICVAPSIIFCIIMSVERGYYEGLQNMFPTAFSEIIETIFKVILGLGFATIVKRYAEKQFYFNGTCFGKPCLTLENCMAISLPFITAAAILGASLASGVACIYIIISTRLHGDGITKAMFEKDKITDSFSSTASSLLKLAMPIAVISVITTLTNMIDMLTINPCISKALNLNDEYFLGFISDTITKSDIPNFVYGSYTGFAVTVFGLVPTITAMFGKSILPTFVESWTNGKFDDACNNLTKMLTVTSYIAIPSGIGLSVLSKQILIFLFGFRTSEIEVASTPLAILGIGVIFLSISLPCFTILQTMGDSKKNIIIMIIGGLIKFVLNMLLIPIPYIGVNGAAIATTVSSFFICIFSLRSIYGLINCKCEIMEIYIKPLYSGLMCGITARLIYNILDNNKFLSINYRVSVTVSILIGGIIYFFTLCLLCETPKKLINCVFSKKNLKNP